MMNKHLAILIVAVALAASVMAQDPVAPKKAARPAAPEHAPAHMVAPVPPAPPAPPVPPLPRIPMAWWKDSRMAKDLNLSPDQLAKLEQTFTENRLKLIDLRANLEKEETRLQPLIEADHMDEAQINSQLDAVVAARGRLEKANAMMSVDMRKLLTQEQWKKLQTMQFEMRVPPPPGAGGQFMPLGHGHKVGYPPPKAPERHDGPNGPEGKGRPTEDQPR